VDDRQRLIMEKNQAFADLTEATLWTMKRERQGELPESWRARWAELAEAYEKAKARAREGRGNGHT
jgi:hypothetical protein